MVLISNSLGKWNGPTDYLNGGTRPEDDLEVEIVGKMIGFYDPING